MAVGRLMQMLTYMNARDLMAQDLEQLFTAPDAKFKLATTHQPLESPLARVEIRFTESEWTHPGRS